jgi:hypothetical protein
MPIPTDRQERGCNRQITDIAGGEIGAEDARRRVVFLRRPRSAARRGGEPRRSPQNGRRPFVEGEYPAREIVGEHYLRRRCEPRASAPFRQGGDALEDLDLVDALVHSAARFCAATQAKTAAAGRERINFERTFVSRMIAARTATAR